MTLGGPLQGASPQGQGGLQVLISSPEPPHVAGEVLVTFDLSGQMSLMSAQTFHDLSGMDWHESESLPAGVLRMGTREGEDVEAALNRLVRTPGILAVQPNYIYTAQATPNDPNYGSQWHLPKISAPGAWDYSRGDTSVLIAVLDSGCDTDHPDLADRLVIIAGSDYVNNDDDPDDDNGHGTRVCAYAAAITDNSTLVASPAWFARILPLKVLNSAGNGSTSNVAQAIDDAVAQGAAIINMSFGAPNVSDPVLNTAMANAVAAGAALFAAAGNGGIETVYYPAASEYVIAVGASTSSDNRASFSCYGTNLDFVAPGSSVTTTTMGGGLFTGDGTSYSSPIAAGAAAVLKAYEPALTPEEIRQRLRVSADDVNTTGFDKATGYGRINMERALELGIPSASYVSDTMTTLFDAGEGAVLGAATNITYASGYGGGLAPRLAQSNSSVQYAETNFTPAQGTIEFYLKPGGFEGVSEDTQFILTQKGDAFVFYNAGNFSLMLNRQMTLSFQLFDGAAWHVISARPYGAGLNPSQWYHVAVSYGPANGLRLFVNGVLMGTDAYAGGLANEPIYVGTASGRSFAGSFDRLRISDEERSLFPSALAVTMAGPSASSSETGTITVNWSAFKTGGGAITVSVYADNDTNGGIGGTLLANGLSNDGNQSVDISSLSAGSTYYMGMVASDGTDTAYLYGGGAITMSGGGSPPSPPSPSPAVVSGSGGGGGGCFVATAAYGNYDAPAVRTLCRFRDELLFESRAGRLGARIYYANSPRLAEWIAGSETRRTAAQVILLPVIGGAVLANSSLGLWVIVLPFLLVISAGLGLKRIKS